MKHTPTGEHAMGDRLVLAARKSRKAPGKDKHLVVNYERQDHKAREDAEHLGHAIVHTAADTVSSQVEPWKRKNLKPWMTLPDKLAMYDGILVSDVDRLARANPKDWHYIEHWVYENGKYVWVAAHGGFRFPAREGAMGIVDAKLWDVFKEAARREWEATRDRHAEGRAIVLANKAASGRPPFGYRVSGETYGKRFDVDPVTGPVALEVFRRIADGQSAIAVAEWLGVQLTVVPFAPVNVRAKRVTNMIRSGSYLGERDGHEFAMLAPNMQDLITTARAQLDSRSVDHGGSRIVHAYSSRIFCQCGANLNHHQTTRVADGVRTPAGQARYRCSRGRRGVSGESRCEYGSFPFDAATVAVEAAVSALGYPDSVVVTTGGDVQRQARLDALSKAIDTAAAQRDYETVKALIAERAEVEASPAAEVVRRTVLTGKSIGEKFRSATLDERREMLAGELFRVVLTPTGVVIDWHPDALSLKADGTARVIGLEEDHDDE